MVDDATDEAPPRISALRDGAFGVFPRALEDHRLPPRRLTFDLVDLVDERGVARGRIGETRGVSLSGSRCGRGGGHPKSLVDIQRRLGRRELVVRVQTRAKEARVAGRRVIASEVVGPAGGVAGGVHVGVLERARAVHRVAEKREEHEGGEERARELALAGWEAPSSMGRVGGYRGRRADRDALHEPRHRVRGPSPCGLN